MQVVLRRRESGRGAKIALWIGFAACALPSIAAPDLQDMRLEERHVIADSAQEVILQGAGVFTYAFMSVYVCALYLAPEVAAEAAWQRDQARRITLIMLRDVSARTFVWALEKGLADNVPAQELAELEERVRALADLMLAHKALRVGDRIDMDYLPDRGTTVLLNGQPIGDVFPEKRFNDALLRVWLGDKPMDPTLKPRLLGK